MGFTIPNEADASNPDQAEVDKVDVDILVAGLAGDGVVSGCAVTAQGSPDMTVAVAAGEVKVGAAVVAVASGNVTVGTAHATLARFDLITVDNAGVKACTAGTASANPVFPAVPASSVVLAAIHVPAVDTTISSGQIVDKRVIVVDLDAAIATQAGLDALQRRTRSVLFNMTSPDGNCELYRADVALEGTPVRITTDTAYQTWWPKASPDGTKILCCRRSVASGGTAVNYDQDYTKISIWVMDADGGNITQIVAVDATGAGAVQGTPNWHPNGVDICFFGATGTPDIYTIQVDGTNLTALSVTGPTGGLTDPCFSPDGTTIAFAADFDIWTVPYPAAGAATALTTDGDNSPVANYDPCYSPDGQNIAYLTKFNAFPYYGIRKMTKDGANETYVVNDNHISSKPAWATDGFLYFHRWVYGTDTTFQLARIQADGSGTVERLTAAGGSARAFPDYWFDKAVIFAAASDAQQRAGVAVVVATGLSATDATNKVALMHQILIQQLS